MTPSTGFRLQGRGLVKRTGSPVQGFAATEEAVWAAVHGSPSLCHPELVSGSGFFKNRAWGVGGRGVERAKELVGR